MEDELVPLYDGSAQPAKQKWKSSLMMIELNTRIKNIQDSPLLERRFSRRNTASYSKRPSMVSSGNVKENQSGAEPQPEVRKPFRASVTSSGPPVMPQFRAGAAVPNSVVRSRQSSISSEPSEVKEEKKEVTEVNILDKIFRRLLPPTQDNEPLDNDELLQKIQKELERRKLLTKSTKMLNVDRKLSRVESTKQTDPEKERRRHIQRITGSKLVDWKRRSSYEALLKSLGRNNDGGGLLITDEELVKQQRLGLSSEPIPLKVTKTTYQTPVSTTQASPAENEEAPESKPEKKELASNTSVTKSVEATKTATLIEEKNLEFVTDLSDNPSSVTDILRAPKETQESDISFMSWQDMIRHISEMEPLKKISLLNLPPLEETCDIGKDSDASDTEKPKRTRKRSSSNSSRTRKSSLKRDKSVGKNLSDTEDNCNANNMLPLVVEGIVNAAVELAASADVSERGDDSSQPGPSEKTKLSVSSSEKRKSNASTEKRRPSRASEGKRRSSGTSEGKRRSSGTSESTRRSSGASSGGRKSTGSSSKKRRTSGSSTKQRSSKGVLAGEIIDDLLESFISPVNPIPSTLFIADSTTASARKAVPDKPKKTVAKRKQKSLDKTTNINKKATRDPWLVAEETEKSIPGTSKERVSKKGPKSLDKTDTIQAVISEADKNKIYKLQKEIKEKNISEKTLLQEIQLLEIKRNKMKNVPEEEREKIQAEINDITEKTKILVEKRRESQLQAETLFAGAATSLITAKRSASREQSINQTKQARLRKMSERDKAKLK